MASTPYMETEALLAVMEEREDDAGEILADMYPGELKIFKRQVRKLADLIQEALSLVDVS